MIRELELVKLLVREVDVPGSDELESVLITDKLSAADEEPESLERVDEATSDEEVKESTVEDPESVDELRVLDQSTLEVLDELTSVDKLRSLEELSTLEVTELDELRRLEEEELITDELANILDEDDEDATVWAFPVIRISVYPPSLHNVR